MTSNSMFEDIKENLADNYRNDDTVLKAFIDEATAIALSISNRECSKENLCLLSSYIKSYVIAKYLNRGGESVNSLSEGGVSSNFKDIRQEMRDNIIKDGLRIIC